MRQEWIKGDMLGRHCQGPEKTDDGGGFNWNEAADSHQNSGCVVSLHGLNTSRSM